MATKALVSSSSTISWSGGRPFDGYVVLSMTLPTGYTKVTLRGSSLRLPVKIKLPVRDGAYVSPSTYIWRTDYLTPPAVVYTAAWYDTTGKLVASDATTRAVTADAYTLNPPTLTDPS